MVNLPNIIRARGEPLDIEQIPKEDRILKRLVRIWGQNNANKMVSEWNRTQVRAPLSIEEIEDVYFGEILNDSYIKRHKLKGGKNDRGNNRGK